MGKNFRETLNQQMRNPEFKKEWDSLNAKFQNIKNSLKQENKKETQKRSMSPKLHTTKQRTYFSRYTLQPADQFLRFLSFQQESY